MHQLPAPSYDESGLAGVLPRAARRLGVRSFGPARQGESPVRQAVVVLIDGLGYQLLSARSGHAPFLRSLLTGAAPATAGFPTTTATSMATFGTGLPPGSHGLVGYQVRIPGTDRLLNELTWDDGPDPVAWQPHPTVFQQAAADGVAVSMVATDYFDGSGLTRAALRGARFATAATLAGRVDLALAALRRDQRALVYLYWGELDRTGHQHGCDSWRWSDELEAIDAQLARLAEGLPRGATMTVTADHGMVDVPHANRLDVADEPDLAAGVDLVGGEMRSLQLYCRPGAVDDVAAAWTARVADRGHVLPVGVGIEAGLFGPVTASVAERLGDLLVVMDGPFGIWDSRVMHATIGELIGQHGALTAAELDIPVLCLDAT